MEKKYAKSGRTKAFFKRNMYYIIMGVCILAIGAMITVALVFNKDQTPIDNNQGDPIDDPVDDPIDDPGDPVVTDPIVFATPVASGTVLQDYTADTIVWWTSLGVYKVHQAIDYTGAEGADVAAAYAGTVEDVTNDPLNGNVVTINHGNGLKTRYSSLGSVSVTKGQVLVKSAKIGTIGNTASKELSMGNHVHFEVLKAHTENGITAYKLSDPYEYLPGGDK